MALINCPHCGKSISDQAVKCPHCGEKLHKIKSIQFYHCWLFVLLGICVLFGLYAWDIESQEAIYAKACTENSAKYYYYYCTLACFLATVGFAVLLTVIKKMRLYLKSLFFIALAGTFVMLGLSAYDRFNPSDGFGQMNLADHYRVREDYEAAAKWYEKAAEQNEWGANVMLGFLYDRGLGVQQDYKKAMQLYQKEIKGESWMEDQAIAYNNIGHLYQEGLGVEKDEQKAIWYYHKALERVETGDSYYDPIRNKVKQHLKELNAL